MIIDANWLASHLDDENVIIIIPGELCPLDSAILRMLCHWVWKR